MRIHVQAKYQSSQVQGNDFDGTGRLVPSFFLTNTFLYWDVLENCSIIIGINNLFDRTYAVSAYSGGFYPGAGRQVYSRIKLWF